jgi:hypothetical protein
MTREAELAAAESKARQREEARAGQPGRLPLMKRLLRALGRTR